VAIVNETFQHKFCPNGDVLGKHIIFNYRNREVEIIGVVADTKYRRQREDNEPLLYTPWQQEQTEIGEMHFALRATGSPTALADEVREAVRGLDSNLPVTEIGTQSARAQATLGQERLYARLLTFFGVIALLLAAIGLFGVLAYSVSQRTKEIGIRMAFGAKVAQVTRLLVWQGMKLVLLGLALSAVIGYVLKHLLEGQYFGPDSWEREIAQQLYGVKLSDPLTLILIATLLTLVALLACWLPARRAAKVDPLVALRYE
jgi:putative ABC transport system permease protein